MDVKKLAAGLLASLLLASSAQAQDAASSTSTRPQSSTPNVGSDKTTTATGGSATLNYSRGAGPAPKLGNDREDEPVVTGAQAGLNRIIDRPHTLVELEGGIITLPNAPISSTQRGGDLALVGGLGRGDATINLGLHILYRFARNWAIGAGGTFAPSPTADSQYGGLSALPRTHARSYFFLGVEARWIPIHYKYFEAWVGVSTGATIIADRYSTNTGTDVPSILGTKEVTIRTEGFAIGGQIGGTYYLSENFMLGANIRAYEWILPDTRRCSSIGDCATLSGAVSSIQFGVTLGYRLPL